MTLQAGDAKATETVRVLADPLRPLVGPKTGVVVDRVLGEVLGDALGVARVERVVVGADVVEVGDRMRFI